MTIDQLDEFDNTRLNALQSALNFTALDKEKYQAFWNIPQHEINNRWLEKLEMHANPIKPPTVIFDIQPWETFRSPATGKVITSKSERREDMKVSGCRDWEGLDNEKKHAASCLKSEEAKSDRKLEEAIGDVWRNMSPSKKDLLQL